MDLNKSNVETRENCFSSSSINVNEIISSKENQFIDQMKNNCSTNDNEDICKENQLNKQEIVTMIKEKNLKKKKIRRRRRKVRIYSQRKRRRNLLKSMNNLFEKEQFWMNKYSIEPFAIKLYRCQLPD